MINPSTFGWIEKFFSEQRFTEEFLNETPLSYYIKVRDTGFIYGHIIGFNTPKPIISKEWFKTEISKVALLNSLFGIYALTEKNINSTDFINKVVAFYQQMNPEGFNLFKLILPKNSNALTLENIINQRVQTNDSLINKNFSHLVTNALLFIDVLAFQQYLIQDEIPEKYFKKIEETVISLVAIALKTKTVKSVHDDLLIKLFEASIRYSKFSEVTVTTIETIPFDYFNNELERYYFVDISAMALWSDGKIENEEAYFLHTLSKSINVNDSFAVESIKDTNEFITKYRKKIPYFNYSNPVKHFYDQTTKNVITLITRNKNRLVKEILQSKELMLLLAHSTVRDLDAKEKKKVKKQLLDICKTIPSLTIFLLPGGTLLLPILIKFIPKLLPSSFNENLEDNE